MAAQITTPIITPAIPSQTFSEIWIKSFTVNAPDCNGGPATMTIIFGLVSRDENGVGTFLDNYSQVFTLPDIFATAATDPTFGALMQGVMGELITQAAEAGLFSVAS